MLHRQLLITAFAFFVTAQALFPQANLPKVAKIAAQRAAQQPDAIATKAYFYVDQGKPKCFFENTPQNLPVTVSYHSLDLTTDVCTLLVSDPNKIQVANRIISHKNAEGRLTYLTKQSGQHSFCVQCNKSKWFGRELLRWSLSIDLGDTEINLKEAAKGITMRTHESLLRDLVTRITNLYKENDYHHDEANQLHVQTRNLGSRVVICGLLQIAVIVFSTYISMMHLSRFFRKEKFVP